METMLPRWNGECRYAIRLFFSIIRRNFVCKAFGREKEKTRSDIPWIEVREDPEFIAFAENFRQQERPSILARLKLLRDKNIVVFEERSEAETFLNQLQKYKETDL